MTFCLAIAIEHRFDFDNFGLFSNEKLIDKKKAMKRWWQFPRIYNHLMKFNFLTTTQRVENKNDNDCFSLIDP